MNTTRSSGSTFKSLTTVLLSAACTAGISALIIIGPEIAWSADPASAPGNPAERPASPATSETVDTRCFMTPLNWSVAEAGPVPTCAREVGGSSSLQAETTQKNRPPAGKPVMLYDAPCFMTPKDWPTAELGPVPRCPRFAGR